MLYTIKQRYEIYKAVQAEILKGGLKRQGLCGLLTACGRILYPHISFSEEAKKYLRNCEPSEAIVYVFPELLIVKPKYTSFYLDVQGGYWWHVSDIGSRYYAMREILKLLQSIKRLNNGNTKKN